MTEKFKEMEKEFDGMLKKYTLNLLGIVYNPETGKILIGRRENDLYIKQLSWCFPGGMPSYKFELEDYLRYQVKIKTGLEIEPVKIIFAKSYPERRDFISIYYYCEIIGGEEKAGEKFAEIKWVRPTEVTEYFTTSLHPTVLEFLETLEEFGNKGGDLLC